MHIYNGAPPRIFWVIHNKCKMCQWVLTFVMKYFLKLE